MCQAITIFLQVLVGFVVAVHFFMLFSETTFIAGIFGLLVQYFYYRLIQQYPTVDCKSIMSASGACISLTMHLPLLLTICLQWRSIYIHGCG